MFYPYQRGKYINPVLWDETWYGNHVGDWEHLTVRLVSGRPYRVFLATHGWGTTYEFGDPNLKMHRAGLHQPDRRVSTGGWPDGAGGQEGDGS